MSPKTRSVPRVGFHLLPTSLEHESRTFATRVLSECLSPAGLLPFSPQEVFHEAQRSIRGRVLGYRFTLSGEAGDLALIPTPEWLPRLSPLGLGPNTSA